MLVFFLHDVWAEGLGRLFTTPDERARLEKLRHPPLVEEKKEEKEPNPDPIPTEPIVIPNITVNGFVIRSDGNNTAWVNGQNSLEGDWESQHIQVYPQIQGGKVTIQLPENGRSVQLRPGETFAPSLSKVTDNYQRPLELSKDKGSSSNNP